MGPADVFRQRMICCFINDPVGVRLIDQFNIDNVCWESDFPHSDSSWPNGPEANELQFATLSDEQVNKVTHENAMRHFSFDPFGLRPKERATVRALRAEAKDVDTVTRVGRAPDQTDRDYFRNLAARPAVATPAALPTRSPCPRSCQVSPHWPPLISRAGCLAVLPAGVGGLNSGSGPTTETNETISPG